MNQSRQSPLPNRVVITLFLIFGPAATLFAGDQAFFGDPPDDVHAWAVHDGNREQPPRVEPAEKIGQPPSDAVVLFDGSAASMSNWEHSNPKRKRDWMVENGYLLGQGGAGYLASKEHFGDCQLHIEWSHEQQLPGTSQQRGNSGVFLMGTVEVQVLDNFDNPTYPDGHAGAVYGVMPPAVNALYPPGKWQSYDIIFRRPVIRDGEVLDSGSMTVLMNGVVVQDSTPLDGGGGFRNRKPFNRELPETGPLTLQDHGNPIRYRNIWYRPLRPRGVEGGTEGRTLPEYAKAKRTETAAKIRSDAETLQGVDRMLRLFESLCYMDDASAREQAEAQAIAYAQELARLGDAPLNPRKSEVLRVRGALKYLQKHQLLAPDFAPVAELEQLADRMGWIKK